MNFHLINTVKDIVIPEGWIWQNVVEKDGIIRATLRATLKVSYKRSLEFAVGDIDKIYFLEVSGTTIEEITKRVIYGIKHELYQIKDMEDIAEYPDDCTIIDNERDEDQ
jgi:hypothetical protein